MREYAVLLVEDDPGEAGLVKIGLRTAPGATCTVTHVETLADAVVALRDNPFDVCLLDLSLPDSQGMMTVRTLADAFPSLPIVVLTGDDSPATEDAAFRNGGQDFLVKGDDADARGILRAIRHARERASMQADLRAQNARFRDFAEASADWFWEMDADLRFTWFSDRLEAVTGVPATALIGKRREEFADVDPTDYKWRAYKADMQACRPLRNFDYTLPTPQGVRWFRINAKPLFDDAGGFVGYRGTGSNITALKRAEAEVEAARALYRSIVQDQTELICRFQADGAVVFGNDAFFRHLDTTADAAIGADLGGLLSGDLATAFLRAATALRDSDKLAQFELPLPRRSGAMAWVLWRVRRVSLAGAATPEFQAVGTDVTVQREQAARLAAEKARAEQATEAKSRFLASMSHEIRTPMTGVLGMAQLLQDGDLDPLQRDYVSNILDAGQTLLALINDILDMAKIEAGRLEIEEVDTSLRSLVERTRRLLAARAEEKGITLDVDWRLGDTDWVRLDPARVRQVLMNLMGNAVKFTGQGGVTVIVEAARRGNGGANGGEAGQRGLKITVADTGIGLSPTARERLFADYVQADASVARRYGGTGLGLAISKRLCELMGGTIGVSSEEGKGSRFWFWVPLHEASAPKPEDIAQPLPEGNAPRRPLTVLVADDNRVNRLLLSTFLGALGHAVDTVENGQDAVDRLKVAPTRYDVVLMDVQMPIMDGVEATQIIRLTPDLSALPVIGVTADAMTDHIAGFKAAGMNAVVAKPIDRADLLRAIDTVVGEDLHPLQRAV